MDYYSNQSYYDILGVKQDASLDSIQKAKDRLKFGDPDDRAPFSMWDKIDEAYNVLSDIEKRREYDKKLEEDIDIYSHSNHGTGSSSNDSGEGTDSSSEENEEEKNEGKDAEGNNTSINEDTEEKEYDLKFVSEFLSKEKELKQKSESSKFKTVAKYVGGTLAGYLVAGPIGAIAVTVWMKKHKKVKLQKDKNPKKITKISTAEMSEIEKYNQTLNAEINRLLSEPHNNYKLEINRIKYKNQIYLLEKLLDIKLNKKVKRTEMLKQKIDVVSTKMQLETAKKNLENIQTKIKEYEKEHGLSKVNKELIEVNQQLAEQKDSKSFSLRKLEAYQTRLLNKRDNKAKRTKAVVVKSGKVYDGLLKAKDFVKSLPYMFKSAEKLDEYMEGQVQRTR